AVVARGDLVEKRASAGFRIDPPSAVSLQFVLEADLLRRDETEGGVKEFQFARARWKFGGRARIDPLVAHEYLFDEHRGRERISFYGRRIDHHDATDGWKPQPTVRAAAAGGLAPACARS